MGLLVLAIPVNRKLCREQNYSSGGATVSRSRRARLSQSHASHRQIRMPSTRTVIHLTSSRPGSSFSLNLNVRQLLAQLVARYYAWRVILRPQRRQLTVSMPPPPKLNDSLMTSKSWNPSQHRSLPNSGIGIYLRSSVREIPRNLYGRNLRLMLSMQSCEHITF